LLHLQGYIDKQNLPIKTVHLADVLAGGGGIFEVEFIVSLFEIPHINQNSIPCLFDHNLIR